MNPTVPAMRIGRGQPRASGVVDTSQSAASGARVMGALIDSVIIGSIDVTVVYFTLKLCGLPFAELRALPAIPLDRVPAHAERRVSDDVHGRRWPNDWKDVGRYPGRRFGAVRPRAAAAVRHRARSRRRLHHLDGARSEPGSSWPWSDPTGARCTTLWPTPASSTRDPARRLRRDRRLLRLLPDCARDRRFRCRTDRVPARLVDPVASGRSRP